MHTNNLSLLLALGVVSPVVWGRFIPRDSYMDDVDTDTDDRRSANTFASRGYFSSGVGVTNSTKTSNGSVSRDEIIDYHSLQSLAASAIETSKSLADTYSTAGNSTCTSDNIRVRKEWWVATAHSPTPIAFRGYQRVRTVS